MSADTHAPGRARAWRVAGALALAGGLSASGAFVWLRTPAGNAWLLARALEAADPPAGSLVVESLQTGLVEGATLRGVEVRDDSGKVLLHADTVRAEWRLGGLTGGVLRVPELAIEGLRADLRLADDGTLDLAAVWGPPSPEPSAPYTGIGVDLLVDSVRVDAPRVALASGDATYALEDGTLSGGLALRGRAVEVRDALLGARRTTPSLGLGETAVGVDLRWVEERLDVQRLDAAVGAQRLAGRATLTALDTDDPGVEVRLGTVHLTPEALPVDLAVRGPIDGTLDVDGTFATPRASLRATTPGGALSADATFDAATTPDRPAWTLQLRAPMLEVGTLLPEVPVGRARLALTLDGAGTVWPDDLTATGTAEVDLAEVALDAGRAVPVFVGGDVSLTKGVLRVEARRIATTGVSASGSVDVDVPASRARARLQRADVALGRLGVYGVHDVEGALALAGSVDVDWSGDTLALATDTRVRVTGLRTPGDVRATRAEGPLVVRHDATGTVIDGTLSVSGVAVGDPVSVAEGSVRADLRLAPDGTPDGTVVVESTATRLGPFRGDHARVATTLRGDALSTKADLTDAGRTVLGLDAEVDLRARSARAERLVVDPGLANPWREDGVQRVRWTDDGIEDAHVRLRAGDAELAVDGRAGASGPLDLAVRLARVELAGLRPFVGDALAGIEGQVDLRAQLGGRAERPEVDADGDVRGLRVEGSVDRLDAHVRAQGAGDAVQVALEAGDGRQELLTVRGSVPVALAGAHPGLRGDGPLDLVVVVRPAESAAWNAVLADDPLPPLQASAELRLHGSPRAVDTDLVATVDLPASADNPEPLRVELDATTRGDLLTLRAVAREQLRRRLEASGTAHTGLPRVLRALVEGRPTPALDAVDTWLAQLDVGLVPLDLPASRLGELAGVAPGRMTGRVLGGVRVTGAALAPTVEGALLLVDGTLGGVPVSPAQVTVTPTQAEDGRAVGYDVRSELGFPLKRGAAPGQLVLEGFVPFDSADPRYDRDGLALRVSGEGVPLEALAALSPDIRDARGRVELRGGVSGSLAAPVPDISLRLLDGDFVIPATNVRYEDVGATVRWTAGQLVLDGLRARTRRVDRDAALDGGAGTLEGSLRFAMSGFTPGEAKGELTLDRAWLLALPDTLLRVREGRLSVTGTWPFLKLKGRTNLDEARMTLDERFFSSNSGALALDPAVRVVRAADATRREVEAVDESLLPRDLRLDIDLDLARAGFIDATMPMEEDLGTVMSGLASIQVLAQIDGQLLAAGRDGSLALTGEVLPLRGTARVLGKPFDIQGGTVAFTGKDYTNPVLDLHAVYETTEHGAITVRITGAADAPKIEFTSTEYPSTDDILSLLIFNRPASEIGAGQGADALSMMMSALGGAVTSELGAAGSGTLDLFEVGTSGLRVGQRLGPKLFLVVSFDPFADPETGSRMGLTLEWKLAPRVDAELSSDLEDTTTLSLRWKKRF